MTKLCSVRDRRRNEDTGAKSNTEKYMKQNGQRLVITRIADQIIKYCINQKAGEELEGRGKCE